MSLLATLLVSGCHNTTDNEFTGYLEGHYAHIAAPQSGWLESAKVTEGDRVANGALLFALDDDQQQMAVQQAQAQLARSQALTRDLSKGARQETLAVIQQQIAAQQAQLKLALADQQRIAETAAQHYSSQAQLDSANANLANARAKLDELERRLAEASLAARGDQQAAAQAEVNALQALLDNARWLLAQRSVTAKVEGTVEEVFFRPGEYINAGTPVISLLLYGQRQVRFFVPTNALAKMRLGQHVRVFINNTTSADAIIRFIASDPEFSPPVIYSRANREELVFMVEADIQGGAALPVGLPVTVQRLPAETDPVQ